MSLNAINNLNFLLNLLIGFLAMKSTDKADKPIIVALINQVKTIFKAKNVLYALCAGIASVFAISKLALTYNPPDFHLTGQLFLF